MAAPTELSAVTDVAAATDGAAVTDGPADTSPSARSPRRWPRRVLDLAVVSTLTMVPFLAIYRPWGGRWRLPLMYAHDANFHAMLVQTMRLTGGFRSTSQLGAPFGQHLEDFPLGTDQAHLLALRALSFVIRDPYVVLDAYYAASFLLVALAAFALLRALGLGRPFAHVGAVLFAYLPYHFWHASARIFLSAYFAVPLGLLLAFWLTTGGVPTRAALRRKSAEHRSARWRLAAIAGCVAIVGCSSPYYAVFSITIIAATCALHAIGDRDRRSIVAGAAVITGIVGVALVSLLPDLLWLRSNPSGASVTSRPLSDADQHGLRLTQVLLPSSRERLAGWIGQGPRARAVVPAEDDAYIGVIGAVGLVIGLVVVLSALSSRRRDHARPPGVRFAATTVVIAILFAEVGGFGFLLSVLGLEQIRTWSRMVLQLALCSLFLGLWYVDRGLARVLAAVRHRARRHASVRVARSRSVPVVAAGAILVLGLADVVPVRGVVPDWHAVEAAVRSDRGFVVGMERELGPGSMVFQLPIADFPEGPPSGRMDVYDLLKGYLSGTGVLSWSHGEVKGRGAEWQHQWARQPARRLVRGLAAAGFDALYVDRFGYPDDAEALDAALRPLLGDPVGSPDSRLRWYDLRPVRARLEGELAATEIAAAGRAVTLFPSITEIAWTGGGSLEIGANSAAAGGTAVQVPPSSATFDIVQRAGTSQTVRLAFDVLVGSGTVRLRWPTGERTLRIDTAAPHTFVQFDIADAVTPVSVEIEPAPGSPPVQLTSVVLDNPALDVLGDG